VAERGCTAIGFGLGFEFESEFEFWQRQSSLPLGASTTYTKCWQTQLPTRHHVTIFHAPNRSASVLRNVK